MVSAVTLLFDETPSTCTCKPVRSLSALPISPAETLERTIVFELVSIFLVMPPARVSVISVGEMADTLPEKAIEVALAGVAAGVGGGRLIEAAVFGSPATGIMSTTVPTERSANPLLITPEATTEWTVVLGVIATVRVPPPCVATVMVVGVTLVIVPAAGGVMGIVAGATIVPAL